MFDKRYLGRRLETAYAESEKVSVIELSTEAFMNVKEMFYDAGLKKDFLMIETVMRRNYTNKKSLRS